MPNATKTSLIWGFSTASTLKALAEGTVEQQRISTIWHPTLDEPIRIKKGDRVQEFCYDPEGNVTRQATRKTSEPELACTQ
ncbi:hypothetical protein [Marinobacter sp. BGYM27]|uniref:hypothetical protein n=1 Tax=Marinobacter sp. BGYM27 TaxID=2975597 RepID=UPI0021A523E7|nr:hypothetical protein [Marinobacter sp. BGYM27]MDG5501682.1 hypothetical protein [Marinobacter sp. BGYM27]